MRGGALTDTKLSPDMTDQRMSPRVGSNHEVNAALGRCKVAMITEDAYITLAVPKFGKRTSRSAFRPYIEGEHGIPSVRHLPGLNRLVDAAKLDPGLIQHRITRTNILKLCPRARDEDEIGEKFSTTVPKLCAMGNRRREQ